MDIKAKEIRMIPLAQIKLNTKNRNKHPKEQIQRLVDILKYQGFRRPVSISNRTGLLVCGEGRYLAAKKIGMQEIPAIFQDYDSEEQEFADGIADNALDKWAELDLSGIAEDVKGLDSDFDLDMMGIRDFEVVEDRQFECDPDEVPEEVEAKTKLGDVYQLGEHRLMCGDSTSKEQVEKLMNGEKADMVFTDPPYGIDYQDIKKKHRKIDNDSSLDGIQSLLSVVLGFDCPMFLCCNWKCFSTFEKAMQDASRSPKACIVWDKGSRVQNLDKFGKQHEFILYSGPFGGQPTVDVDVWQCKRQVLTGHPTAKPIEIIERAIGHFKSKNILDLFGGSGSTLIACEKTNRKCFMMELDPHYCDVIVARWEKFTGKKAELMPK